MDADKLKQYVALIGGVLGALLLFFQAVNWDLSWFNENSIAAFVTLLTALAPLVAVFYGIYKNQYFSKKAQKQEEVLKDEGLK